MGPAVECFMLRLGVGFIGLGESLLFRLALLQIKQHVGGIGTTNGGNAGRQQNSKLKGTCSMGLKPEFQTLTPKMSQSLVNPHITI